MLRKPLLLLIDPHGLEVWQHTDGLLQARAGFDAHGHEAFSNWLAGLQQRPSCRVLVNLPDEDYEYEDLPRTRGRDRRALIARRCAAWFPHTPFVHAWAAGPAPNLRSGAERFVFAGLERPAPLQAWLAVLQRSQVRVSHLIPAASLVPTLPSLHPHRSNKPDTGTAPDASAALVAGFTRSGLRLSLIRGQKLLFSRLIPHCTVQFTPGSPSWEEEIERTCAYLQAQPLLAADTPLCVHLLAAPATLARQAAPEGHSGTTGPRWVLAPAPPGRQVAVVPRQPSPPHADSGRAALEDFDTLLLTALIRVRAAEGWPARSTGGATAPLRLSRTRLAVGGLFAAASIAGGAWFAHGTAAPPPVIEPASLVTLPPDLPAHGDEAAISEPAAHPEAPPQPKEAIESPPTTAPPQRTPRTIEGIIHHHGGRTRIWADDRLLEADSAGLRTLSPTMLSPLEQPRIRLRVGDTWPLPPPPPEDRPGEPPLHEGGAQ